MPDPIPSEEKPNLNILLGPPSKETNEWKTELKSAMTERGPVACTAAIAMSIKNGNVELMRAALELSDFPEETKALLLYEAYRTRRQKLLNERSTSTSADDELKEIEKTMQALMEFGNKQLPQNNL